MIVYISGKYTNGDIDGNIAIARKVAIELWEKGYMVFCPHLNTAHFEIDCKAGYEDYLRGDLEMVARCDVMVMIPNWLESRGAQKEKAYAVQLKIPVFYYPDLPPLEPRMTEEQELHLQAIKTRICQRLDEKYRRGQKEHGGNLFEKPVLGCLLEEVQDFIAYSHTLEDQIEAAVWLSSNYRSKEAMNVLLFGNAEGKIEGD